MDSDASTYHIVPVVMLTESKVRQYTESVQSGEVNRPAVELPGEGSGRCLFCCVAEAAGAAAELRRMQPLLMPAGMGPHVSMWPFVPLNLSRTFMAAKQGEVAGEARQACALRKGSSGPAFVGALPGVQPEDKGIAGLSAGLPAIRGPGSGLTRHQLSVVHVNHAAIAVHQLANGLPGAGRRATGTRQHAAYGKAADGQGWLGPGAPALSSRWRTFSRLCRVCSSNAPRRYRFVLP